MIDLLRRRGALTVTVLAGAMSVTATAVRQRLNRLMGQGLVDREVVRDRPEGRGRPSHRYSLTERGRRGTGSNFSDLSIALWQEIRKIKDSNVQRGLLNRVATTLADGYAPSVTGATVADRMRSVGHLLADRDVPFSVDDSGELPVLTAEACPYPDLAEQDRSICAMERMLFSQLVDADLRLSACRLDGANCCTFETV